MTIGQYDALDQVGQHEAIWEHGFMIGKRVEGEYEITIYSVFAFYVELYYHVKLLILERLKTSSKVESLYAYQKPISFKSVFKVPNRM